MHLGHARTRLAHNENGIKIVCISDTHNYNVPLVPDGDILIHAGDLTVHGSVSEVQRQLDWLRTLPHRYKIVVAGNHDRCLDENYSSILKQSRPDWSGLTYLCNSTVDVEVSNKPALRIFGSPYTPKFGNFAFQYDRETDYWQDKIPAGTDVVVTHGPPLGHHDINPYGAHVGCPHLLRALRTIKPTMFICGHIHESHGESILMWDDLQEAWEQATMGKHTVRNTMTIFKHQLQPGAYGSWFGFDVPSKRTHLVNAAIAGSQPGQHQAPVVVYI